MRVIKADVELGRSCQASWSAQFQLAARELMGDPRLPGRCSYAAWFKHGDGIGINHMAPHLLNRQLSTEVRTSLTRFRLGNSGLGVEKARVEGNNNENLHDFMLSPCAPFYVHLALKCVASSYVYLAYDHANPR
ncbi:hypothetical protein HaLaN_31826 [Haematococcus lacustris]|uniref:Uncharacterized protein n=1 Tax=Haematococcus lacustris TaxID=44745 RepID=A0A6A0AIM9_HAELA|nr:hypothetical protein HaLaN_31826 [Haematococcus lacustris]